MKFGVFDHMDDSGVPLQQQFDDRLKLIEAYDHYGFHAYHIAEHHCTPLGFAPSPGIFLAAVARHSRTLRFGPLVYSLPLYHPVRLIEEICMLDHLSGGRFDLGVGRGVSPIEVGFFGVNPDDGPRQFPEALQLIKQGLAAEELTFHGEFYDFDRVPMVLRPVQAPYPPLWYGVVAPETAHWAALEQANMVTLAPTDGAKAVIDRYREEWAGFGHAEDTLPLMGVMRLVVLSESRQQARDTAERAYAAWLGHMRYLWDQHGMDFPLGLPPEIGPLLDAGAAFAGTPAEMCEFIDTSISGIGASYFSCDIAFGDMGFAEAMTTTRLLGEQVMPACA